VAVLAVLGRTLGETGASALKALLDSARLPSLRIAALGSPFDSKDALKARGYRWHAEAKGWVGEIAAAGKEEELEWLKKTVYEGKNVEVEIETLTAKQRYAERSGKNERMRI
jgi:DNA polymerase III subunit epsilon